MFQHGETRDWLSPSEFLRTSPVVTGVVSPDASALSTAILRESPKEEEPTLCPNRRG